MSDHYCSAKLWENSTEEGGRGDEKVEGGLRDSPFLKGTLYFINHCF